MSQSSEIPVVDGDALAGVEGDARDRADALVAQACRASGFMVVVPPAGGARFDDDRRSRLLSVFDLPESAKRRLYRRRYVETNVNRYRGLAPMSPSQGIGTENLDLGADAVAPGGRGDTRDVLCEPSAWPAEDDLPGWRDEAARTFAGFEALGGHLLRSIERVLGLEPRRLEHCFEASNSTLTLARHPRPGEWDESLCERLDAGRQGGERLLQLVLPHTDSGCVTFVSQDELGGLQARGRDGSWVPVPTAPGWLAVNFGKLLERWTGGAVRATEHRVVGTARRRTSIPFFLEPAVDAVIEPLPGAEAFEPFSYGDWVWKQMQRFPDYQGLGPRFLDESAADG